MSPLPQAEADIGGDTHVREQRVGLEHRVDRPAVRRQRGQVGAIEHDPPGVGPHKPGHGPQQGGLAGPRTAEQHEQFVAPHRQIQAVERHRRPVADSQAATVSSDAAVHA